MLYAHKSVFHFSVFILQKFYTLLASLFLREMEGLLPTFPMLKFGPPGIGKYWNNSSWRVFPLNITHQTCGKSLLVSIKCPPATNNAESIVCLCTSFKKGPKWDLALKFEFIQNISVYKQNLLSYFFQQVLIPKKAHFFSKQKFYFIFQKIQNLFSTFLNSRNNLSPWLSNLQIALLFFLHKIIYSHRRKLFIK